MGELGRAHAEKYGMRLVVERGHQWDLLSPSEQIGLTAEAFSDIRKKGFEKLHEKNFRCAKGTRLGFVESICTKRVEQRGLQ